MTDIASYLAEIDAFKTRTGLSDAAIGRAATKDPNYVYRLRAGAQTFPKTMEKVRTWMNDYEEGMKS